MNFVSNTTNKMTTVRELREYGRHLGIRGLWRKNKMELQEHLFNTVHEEVNERMLRRPNIDPERAFMEAELALRSKKLTTQKTWRSLRQEARAADIPVNRRTRKEDIENQLVQKRSEDLEGKYRRRRVKNSFFRDYQDLVAHMALVEDGDRVKSFQISGNLNHVNSKLIMSKITPHIEMRCKVIYSFIADIYQADGVVKGYGKKIHPPPGMFTSLAEIMEYIEASEQKRLETTWRYGQGLICQKILRRIPQATMRGR